MSRSLNPSTTPSAPEVLPRRGVLLLGAVLAGTLVAVGAARLNGWPARDSDAATLQERALRFLDRPDGSVEVIDAATGRTLDVLVGEQGFVRGTLRGMARERRRQGLTADAPMRLIARADGRLTLLDDSTGRRIDLESFGPTNAASFARWLAPAGAPTRAASP
jgi:putative photosynthetic complex assembly protein